MNILYSPLFTKISFLVSAIITATIVLCLNIKLLKEKNKKNLYTTIPMTIGLVSILIYIGVVITGWTDVTTASQLHKKIATLFSGLYFMSLDWLCASMLFWAMNYCDHPAITRKIAIPITVISAFDTASLIINTWTEHSFVLKNVEHNTPFQTYTYWAAEFKPIHYTHLGFDYLLVASAFVFLVYSLINSSTIYRKKYGLPLLFYVLIIIADFFCFSTKQPINFNVIFYGAMAGYLAYYASIRFPYELVFQSLRNVNETINDGILYFTNEGDCTYANKEAKKIFVDGRYFSKKMAMEFYKNWKEDHKDFDLEQEIDNWTFNVDGKIRTYRAEFQKLYNHKSQIGIFFKFKDNTEELERLEKERYIATHDELTGIYNSVGFFEAVDEKMKNLESDEHYVMLASDIRDFKFINEIFGEKVGDQVLKKNADLIREYSHPDNIFGHISDDNFALFMKKKYLIHSLFEKCISEMGTLTVSASYQMHVYVGIYEVSNLREKAQVMYDKAVMAIGAIQNNYQQIFSYYNSDLMDKVLAEKNVIAEFEKSFENRNFILFLQPRFDREGNLAGSQSLITWQHPTRGQIAQSEFYNVLEKTGLNYNLDLYIWEEAVKTIADWIRTGKEIKPIALNISVKDIFFLDIYKSLTSLVEQYSIPANLLIIQITEKVLTSDEDKTLDLLAKLKQYGFKISIDDFGSVFSSLNILKDIDADIICMDCNFIQEGENQGRSIDILTSVLAMFQKLGMQVLIKGITNSEQLYFLKDLKCNFFMGSSLSAPLSVEEFNKKY